MLVVETLYAPSGTSPVGGGYYRVVDTGIRCVRAPCYSYRAMRVNGSTRTRVSGLDVDDVRLTTTQRARADAALRTHDGLYARGQFVSGADGGRVFRALRLYLRVPRSRA